jgi:hypothetical protein
MVYASESQTGKSCKRHITHSLTFNTYPSTSAALPAKPLCSPTYKSPSYRWDNSAITAAITFFWTGSMPVSSRTASPPSSASAIPPMAYGSWTLNHPVHLRLYQPNTPPTYTVRTAPTTNKKRKLNSLISYTGRASALLSPPGPSHRETFLHRLARPHCQRRPKISPQIPCHSQRSPKSHTQKSPIHYQNSATRRNPRRT